MGRWRGAVVVAVAVAAPWKIVLQMCGVAAAAAAVGACMEWERAICHALLQGSLHRSRSQCRNPILT